MNPTLQQSYNPRQLCLLHDIAVEPVAFLRKLVVTVLTGKAPGKQRSPKWWQSKEEGWHRLLSVSTHKSSSGIQVGEQEWTRLGET